MEKLFNIFKKDKNDKKSEVKVLTNINNVVISENSLLNEDTSVVDINSFNNIKTLNINTSPALTSSSSGINEINNSNQPASNIVILNQNIVKKNEGHYYLKYINKIKDMKIVFINLN